MAKVGTLIEFIIFGLVLCDKLGSFHVDLLVAYFIKWVSIIFVQFLVDCEFNVNFGFL